VYNPAGPTLPPSQEVLQRDYTQRLAEDFDIVFNELFVITNMPIQRFGSSLLSTGHFDSYLDTLRASHLDSNLQHVMCKNTVSVDWQGNLYDCDFNQMLEHPIADKHETALHVRDFLKANLDHMPIKTGNHCYGCTAGQGSSCSGALNAV
jgi:radical SAM/Cys-rich protein